MATTLTELTAPLTLIADGVTALKGSFATQFRSGTHTTDDLEHVRASAAGYLADIKTLRTDLDSTDIETLVVNSEDAARTLKIRIWERDVRTLLVKMAGDLIDMIDIAADLKQRAGQKIVLVRSGDTIQGIARRELGDWSEWTRIVEANPGLDPGTLTSGQTIIIPERR